MATTPPNLPANTPADPTKKPASKKDHEDDTFMREVDEAVRQDEVSDFAKKFGLPIGIAVLVALLAFGGYLIWSGQQQAALEEGSEQLVAALDELEAGNGSVADAELAALAAGDSEGAALMANMLRAGIALGEDRTADAVSLYGAVADNPATPPEIRDLAAIRMMTANFDTIDPQQVIDRIGPLATPDNPYFGSAGELVAFAYLAQNKPDQAGPLFAQIAKNEDVPQSLRSRTRQLAGLLGYDAIEDVDEMLEEMAVETPAQGAPN